MKEKTIVDMLEDVANDICNHYCKYSELYQNEEDEDKLYKHCDECPLNRLM